MAVRKTKEPFYHFKHLLNYLVPVVVAILDCGPKKKLQDIQNVNTKFNVHDMFMK